MNDVTTSNQSDQPVAKSLDDIAALLAENSRNPALRRKDDVSKPMPAEVTDTRSIEERRAAAAEEAAAAEAEEVELEATEEETTAEEAHAAEEATQLGDETEHDESQEEAPQEAADDGELEIDDDDQLELDDGALVSIKELKQVYKADAVKLTAVQEAETMRTEARETLERATHQAAQTQQFANAMTEHMVQIVEQPLVSPPEESLKASNPGLYIQQLDAFQQDQQRIASARDAVSGAIGQFQQQQEIMQREKKTQAIRDLQQLVPQLQNEGTKLQASKDILEAGEYFKFTPEEINNAADARIYQMAYYAKQYLKMVEQSGTEPERVEEVKTQVKRTRRLRSSGTTAQTRQTTAQKQARVLKSRAQKSGKVDDVAAFIASKRR